jgi:hypothetical protein
LDATDRRRAFEYH